MWPTGGGDQNCLQIPCDDFHIAVSAVSAVCAVASVVALDPIHTGPMVKEGSVLKCLLHFFQREQEMRMGEMGPRGAINMGGTGVVSPDITKTR